MSLKTKLLALSLAATLIAEEATAQADDPVLMNVNGMSVSRSEFISWYNLNHDSDSTYSVAPKDFVNNLVDYKLQVAEAYALRLDTLSYLKTESNNWRDAEVENSLVTDAEWDAEMRRIYDETKENVGTWGLIRPAHILLYVRQDASNSEFESARRRADSIYMAIRNGADFAQMARKYSQDEVSAARGGELPWIQPNQTWKEFETAAYSMNVGDVSRPVQSPIGFHIIKLLEKKQLEPFDSLRDMLAETMEKREIREKIICGKINEIVKASGNTLEPSAALDKLMADTEQQNPDLKFSVKAYCEDLLAMAALKRYLDSKKPYTEASLKAYFAKNKKRYYWDEPRFRGIVIHARDKQDISRVTAAIKNVPYDMWDDVIEKNFNSGQTKLVSYDKSLFVKGQNKYVDKMKNNTDVFEDKGNEFPYTAVYGTMLKKKAVTYADVRAVVIDDYEAELQAQWIESLRKKYPVEINYDILKTVNQDNK